MKKILKIAIILIMILTIQIQMNYCYAAVFDDVDSKIQTYKPDEVGDETQLVDKISIIAVVIRNVGIAIAVIALMIIGIRNMLASAEEKSIIKQSLPGYLVGIVLVVSISLLPSIIEAIMKQINNSV